jgi:hypothetical protein
VAITEVRTGSYIEPVRLGSAQLVQVRAESILLGKLTRHRVRLINL